MNRNLVSVIVPCYKQAEYLSEALDSVHKQSYDNWECIIINDRSPDNTQEIALAYCKTDSRFKYVMNKKNSGVSIARNVGIKISSGKYILPLDADDKIGINYIKEAVLILDEDQKIKIVYAEAELFGEEEGVWKLPDFSLKQLALDNMIYCSAFFRRTDFDLYGGYDEVFVHGSEDWEFWLRILRKGGNVKKLSDTHFYYRIKKNSRSDKLHNSEMQQIEMRTQLFLKHCDLYIQLFGDPILAYSRIFSLKSELEEKCKVIKALNKSNYYRFKDFLVRSIGYFKN